MDEIGEFDLENTFGHLVGRISRLINLRIYREFKQSGYDITPEMFVVLSRLSKEDGLTQVFLSDAIEKDMPTVSRIIDNLEKRNLVVRIPDTTDRRNKKIYLTRLGKTTQASLSELVVRLDQRFQSQLPEGLVDEKQLMSELDRIYRSMKQFGKSTS